ncbi:MAG: hypothetical protein IT244_06920 [Bacteroidia bacterium]|nr:hypothetical protein [Bacteroidia bacterium]
MEEEEEIKETPIQPEPSPASDETEDLTRSPWLWVRFGFVAFSLMLFYIWNQHHANKGLRQKEILIKELKELHSEKISLESEVTKASKQSEIAEKLKETGLKELTKPPVKIEYQKDKK